jgi:hypothetical protein
VDQLGPAIALELPRQLVGVTNRPARAVGQGLETVFLIALEDLVTGLARNAERATSATGSDRSVAGGVHGRGRLAARDALDNVHKCRPRFSRDARSPEKFEDAQQFEAALFRAAVADPVVHRAMMEVAQLLQPHSLLHEPDILRRIEAVPVKAAA